jgi:hypothetical protein
MGTPLNDVVHVRVLADYRLHLRFDDGMEGEVDVSQIVPFDGVFEPLRELDFFRRVRLDPEAGTICWPNETDLAPETLYQALTHREHHPERVFKKRPDEPAPGTETSVPEICRFLGIVIQMYFAEHQAPHFHATYAGNSARFEIETLNLMSGELPVRVRGLVAEWAALHRQELLDNWDRARRREKLLRITPLE